MVLEATRVLAPQRDPAAALVLEVEGVGAEAERRVTAARAVLVRADVQVIELRGARVRGQHGGEGERARSEPAHHCVARRPLATASCFAASPPVHAVW